MAELHTTFTLAPASAWRPADSRMRWFAPAWSVLPLSPRTCRVRNPLNGCVAELDAEQYTVLSACDGCRTLHEHAADVRRKLGTRDEHRATIDKWVGEFASAGLLVGFDALVGRLEAAPPHAIAPFGGILIRTCDRPELLERALKSAAVMQARGTPRYRYGVLDDSRSDAARAANRRVAAKSGLDCRYEDLSSDGVMLVELRRAFPGAHDALDWLCGVPRDGETTYGRSVNVALLMSAGQRILMLDDDAQVTPRSPPLMSSGFGISSAADELFCFRSLADLEQQCPPLDLDPVASHLDCLGQSARVLYERFAGRDTGKLAVLDLSRDDGARFVPGAVVRLTQNQALGDPGSSLFPYHLLTLPSRSRQRLESDPAWRDYVLGQRCNWRGQAYARLAPNRPMTFTTLSGLDNGSMLPPTVRAHRNEDLLLGEMTRIIDPGAWMFDLPWALPHYRHPAKTWLDSSASFPQEPVHFLLDYLESKGAALASETPAARMRALGAMLADLAAASEGELTDMLEQHAADAASRTRFQISVQLDDPTISAAWKTFLKPWLDSPTLSVQPKALRERLAATGTVRDLAGSYGRALDVWPSLWNWARERNEFGRE